MARNLIICGLDGVLIDAQPTGGAYALDGASTRSLDDADTACAPQETTVRMLRHLIQTVQEDHGSSEVWILSGRSTATEKETVAWLEKSRIPFQKLVLRGLGDDMPEPLLKQRWLKDGTIPRGRICCVYDAGAAAVKMWRSEGISCYQTA